MGRGESIYGRDHEPFQNGRTPDQGLKVRRTMSTLSNSYEPKSMLNTNDQSSSSYHDIHYPMAEAEGINLVCLMDAVESPLYANQQ